MTSPRYIFRTAPSGEWARLDIAHWQHSLEYLDFQHKLNRDAEHLIIEEESSKKIIGYFAIIHYPLGYGLKLADIPYGPVWLSSPDDTILDELANFLRDYASRHKLIFLRLELPRPHQAFRQAPYPNTTSFAQAEGEALLNLKAPIDTLWHKCSKSTRRNITASQKNNLSIEFAYGNDLLGSRDDFICINQATTQAHHTTTHSDTHFKILFEALAGNKKSFVAVVRDSEQEIHAINIITIFGKHAYCPYGASTERGKRELGAYYFIKWEIIKHLKEQGIQDFNWGGISVGEDDASLAGLNQFKLGFGGEKLLHYPRYDLPTSWWYYPYIGRAYFKQILKMIRK
ncbi:MAG: lipid II:glycine glycyltransferase FemX [Patescibacteria group bacterium]